MCVCVDIHAYGVYRGTGGQESACATLCGTLVLCDEEVNSSASVTLPLWQYKWALNQGVHGFHLFLLWLTTSPALEKTRSHGTDVAGMWRYFLAILKRFGYSLT